MYRCRICGETYLGTERPSRCPFCGAHSEYMVDTLEYPPAINDIQLTETERGDLHTAIETERSNTRFYLGMSEHRDNEALSSAYKRLARVEAEHCSLFCRLAGLSKPVDLLEPAPAPDDWCANIDESIEREQRASALYAGFVARATNERLREVWTAVSSVEADHIELDGVAKSIAGC